VHIATFNVILTEMKQKKVKLLICKRSRGIEVEIIFAMPSNESGIPDFMTSETLRTMKMKTQPLLHNL